jgi:hypothetical protein
MQLTFVGREFHNRPSSFSLIFSGGTLDHVHRFGNNNADHFDLDLLGGYLRFPPFFSGRH